MERTDCIMTWTHLRLVVCGEVLDDLDYWKSLPMHHQSTRFASGFSWSLLVEIGF